MSPTVPEQLELDRRLPAFQISGVLTRSLRRACRLASGTLGPGIAHILDVRNLPRFPTGRLEAPCFMISYTPFMSLQGTPCWDRPFLLWVGEPREGGVSDIPEKMPSNPEMSLPWPPLSLLLVPRGTGCLWHCFCTPSAPWELSELTAYVRVTKKASAQKETPRVSKDQVVPKLSELH